jgi:hypothetical protein
MIVPVAPFSLPLIGQAAEVLQHLPRVRLDLLHQVCAADDALPVDQVGGAVRSPGSLLPGIPADPVPLPHRPVHVRDQEERECELLGERPVRLRRVKRRAENLGAQGFELRGSITEPLTLDPSPGRVRDDEPPQHHPSAAEVVQGYGPAEVIGQGEGGRRGSLRQHAQSLGARDAR